MKRIIPRLMILVRALLGPGIILCTRAGDSGLTLAAIVLFCLVDDIFDGILARRWGTDTAALRLSDSSADTVFYLGVAWSLWLRFPQMIRMNAWLLVALFALELLRYTHDFAKYRKAAAYHSYLAKFWGLVLASAMMGAFFGAGWLVRTAILLGILVNLEGLSMSLLLPRWQNDVKTLAVAVRVRREQLSAESR